MAKKKKRKTKPAIKARKQPTKAVGLPVTLPPFGWNTDDQSASQVARMYAERHRRSVAIHQAASDAVTPPPAVLGISTSAPEVRTTPDIKRNCRLAFVFHPGGLRIETQSLKTSPRPFVFILFYFFERGQVPVQP